MRPWVAVAADVSRNHTWVCAPLGVDSSSRRRARSEYINIHVWRARGATAAGLSSHHTSTLQSRRRSSRHKCARGWPWRPMSRGATQRHVWRAHGATAADQSTSYHTSLPSRRRTSLHKCVPWVAVAADVSGGHAWRHSALIRALGSGLPRASEYIKYTHVWPAHGATAADLSSYHTSLPSRRRSSRHKCVPWVAVGVAADVSGSHTWR
jgi:hypothetical protein